MQEPDDNALLREYVERNSSDAFAALVTRHVNKVYSVALRHTGNPSQAEEITQAVFVILAQKSRHLSKRVILSGWLYQTTRLTALTQIRSQIRRARREQEAHMQQLANESESETWNLIAPMLDDAMADLNESDRHAVVLRFFDGKSLREVGTVLGANEDAAKKRVSRALEKLRKFFLKRGVISSAAIIAGAMATNSVQAAPVGLVQTATAIALTKDVAASGSILTLTKGALKVMAWTKAKTAILCTIAIGTATFSAIQYQAQLKLRSDNQLEQQQIEQLKTDNAELSKHLTSVKDAQSLSTAQRNELLKLRGEVARLRVAQQQAQLKSTGANTNDPFTQSVLALVARAVDLNRHLEQMPEKKIPELQILSENDWLTAAKDSRFDTDADVRNALRKLRNAAKAKLPLGSALFSFTHDNKGQLPNDLSQLKPYMPGLDDATLNAIFARYTLLRTGPASEVPADSWVVIEKAPVDQDYDSRAKFGVGRSSIIDTGLNEAGDPDYSQ